MSETPTFPASDLPVYGFDIETDTRVDGRDPHVAAVITAAIADADGAVVVAAGDEATILRTVNEALAALPPGILATWNGAGFDLPFWLVRCAVHGIDPGWAVAPVAGESKYQPLPGMAARYGGRVAGHRHVDIAWPHRSTADALGVTWSLKPLAHALGIDAVVAERERAGELSRHELVAYCASDAHVTVRLAGVLGDRLFDALDA
jgi:DNA polymerase elongation subunit (family B)